MATPAVISTAYGDERKLRTITVTWTSSDLGAATDTVYMEGAIVRVVTNPGATAPTADYDITFVDANGVDIMSGTLADRHTSTSEQVIPATPPFHTPSFTFTLANAGDTKDGVCVIYVAWV